MISVTRHISYSWLFLSLRLASSSCYCAWLQWISKMTIWANSTLICNSFTYSYSSIAKCQSRKWWIVMGMCRQAFWLAGMTKRTCFFRMCQQFSAEAIYSTQRKAICLLTGFPLPGKKKVETIWFGHSKLSLKECPLEGLVFFIWFALHSSWGWDGGETWPGHGSNGGELWWQHQIWELLPSTISWPHH